jgi:hypothetical protein
MQASIRYGMLSVYFGNIARDIRTGA